LTKNKAIAVPRVFIVAIRSSDANSFCGRVILKDTPLWNNFIHVSGLAILDNGQRIITDEEW